MTRYEVLIACERDLQRISPDECEDPVNDCRQSPQIGVIDLDHEPSASEIARMNDINHIADCTQTGCRRFLESTFLTPIPPYSKDSVELKTA
jgi:hypothetical protein